MRLTPERITQSLKNDGLMPLYVISGDEPLLIQEACDAIRQQCRKNSFEERVVFDVDGKFAWSAFLEETNSLSLFSQRKIIELRFKAGKLAKEAAQALESYIANTSPDTIVIIQSPKLERAESAKKWFKEADKIGAIVTIWPIDREKFPQWIVNRAQKENLKISAEALELLVDKTEGNLLAATQEIQKMALIAVTNEITPDLVLSSVAESAKFEVFDLVNVMLQRNTVKSLHILSNLLAEGVQPTIILWALSRQIRQLYDAVNSPDALARIRLPNKTMESLRRYLRKVNKTDLDTLLTLSHSTDKAIKGVIKAHPKELLSQLVTTFCNPALKI
ncbi:MAG: DNA polymerase III subunit delta [Hahellaceae bacterium]|nr:DNA polymerase III subunit delta [Hahellaceae bacterium]MCP5211184.1 DNA polymerase III subunit delta [Hahellaceae bacterium]